MTGLITHIQTPPDRNKYALVVLSNQCKGREISAFITTNMTTDPIDEAEDAVDVAILNEIEATDFYSCDNDWEDCNLSAEDFQKYFKMDIEKFNALPGWKKQAAKKNNKLF